MPLARAVSWAKSRKRPERNGGRKARRMTEQQGPTIDYYVWFLSDWAYLGGVRFVQMAARHGINIKHIPMRMQDVYAGSGGILLANRSWQRQGDRITEFKGWRSAAGVSRDILP